MRRRILGVIIFITLILTGCKISPATVEHKSEEPAKKQLNMKELFGYQSGYLLPEKGYAESRININMTEDGLNQFVPEPSDYTLPDPKNLSKQEVMEMLEDLFEQMKYSFGDYVVSGGDEAFENALLNIESRLNSSNTEEEYAKVIIEEMDFVENNHFTPILGYWLGINFDLYWEDPDNPLEFSLKNYYADKSLKFWKSSDDKFYLYLEDAEGILTENKSDDNSAQFLEFRGDDNPSITLNPSWDKEFNLVYKAYIYSDPENQPKEILLRDANFNKKLVPASWEIPVFHDEENISLHPKINYIDGLPYVSVRGDSIGVDQLNTSQFKEIGQELSKHKVGIIDLRGNSGGYSHIAMNVLAGYTGEDLANLPYSFEHVEKATKKRIESVKHLSNGDAYRAYNNSHLIVKAVDRLIQKDGLIVVLIDSLVASAGEMTLDALRHLSNTIVVGMPTSGTINSSAGAFYPLKNLDGFYAQIPDDQLVWHPDYFQEKTGFKPDIWVTDLDINNLANYLKTFK